VTAPLSPQTDALRVNQCPHDDIRFCPLYVAAHMPNAGGCDDGRLIDGGCAVTRGMDYADEHRRLEREQFEMVARVEFAERRAASSAQRDRNMRMLRART
jgi:hypothetical protein